MAVLTYPQMQDGHSYMTAKQPQKDDPGNKHPIRTYWLTGGLVAVLGIIITIVLALKAGSGTSSAPPPTPSPSRSATIPQTPTPTPTVQAAFVSPTKFATNVPAACTLTATGTVQHLEQNHHLWLFLYFYDDKYFAGGSLTFAKDKVHWSGRIFIGGNKQPGQDFVLWLFDLGPNGWTRLNTDIDGQNNGFNGWQLANDVTRIAYVDFTTGHEKCQA